MPTSSMCRAIALRLNRNSIRTPSSTYTPSRLPLPLPLPLALALALPPHHVSPWMTQEAKAYTVALPRSETATGHDDACTRRGALQGVGLGHDGGMKRTRSIIEQAGRASRPRGKATLPKAPPKTKLNNKSNNMSNAKSNTKTKTKTRTKTKTCTTTTATATATARTKQRQQEQSAPLPPRWVRLSKTCVTWGRVHKVVTQRAASPGPWPTSKSPSRSSKHRKIDPSHLIVKLRGMHLQWGHLRHQYPASELLYHRRRFTSWKNKFHNIMAGRNVRPYPWSDRGRWLFELDGVPSMRRAWGSLDAQQQQDDWPLVMLSTLASCPGKADAVLEATLDPLPPGYAVLDVLTFVSRTLRPAEIKDVRQRRVKAEQLLDLLTRILEHMPPGHMPSRQRMLGLFARKLPRDLAGELLAALQRLGHRLHPHTMLQFARRLAGHVAHKEQALGILEDLAHGGWDLNGPVARSAITSLLHCRPEHEGWSDETAAAFSPRRVLERLMERGLSPNHINATAFLDSLCHRSEVEEAIRLALLFSESGVALDTRAWATVFRGAKHSLKTANVVRSFDVAKAANAPLVDVLNNALHAVYYFADAESRAAGAAGAKAPWVLPLFEPMLCLYAQRFRLEPLQHFIPDSLPLVITQPDSFEDKFEGHRRQQPWRFPQTIVPAVNGFFRVPAPAPGQPHRPPARLQPTTTTLALMLRAYIRTLRQPYDLMAFYSFFKSRLEDPDPSPDPSPDAAPLAARLIRDQGSLIHDTIIMTMTERRGLSRPALQVFGDMLKQHLSSSSSSTSSSSSSRSNPNPDAGPGPGPDPDPDPYPLPTHPAPSLCTYSILIRGLIARGDRLLAEQVIRVMRDNGVEPDLVAWNTLVKGYASMQDIGNTVRALQDMEAAGFRPDHFTFKAFGALRDQGRALEMMEGIIHQNRQAVAVAVAADEGEGEDEAQGCWLS